MVGDDYGKYITPKTFEDPMQYRSPYESFLETARRMFNELDKDNSGWLDESELRNMIVETFR